LPTKAAHAIRLCPKCGIDAVLSSKHPIEDNNFLDEMIGIGFNGEDLK